jgi:hypothetical protein
VALETTGAIEAGGAAAAAAAPALVAAGEKAAGTDGKSIEAESGGGMVTVRLLTAALLSVLRRFAGGFAPCCVALVISARTLL